MGVLDFEALNDENNALKEKFTKNIFEQNPVGVVFPMTSKIGNPTRVERFDKNCVEYFVGNLIYFQEFLRNFLKSIKKSSTERFNTEETEKNFRESKKCWFCCHFMRRKRNYR